MILSIDTTSEFGSIALTEGNQVIEEVALHAPEGFGHVLFDYIRRLLEKNGITGDRIDVFAAASGPGSFTGVRVGLTAAKGLAEAGGKRVVAVSNLRALAFFGSAPLRGTVIDARRGEVYAAVYDAAYEIVLPEVVMKLDAWLKTLEKLNTADLEFISMAPVAGLTHLGIFKIVAPQSLAAAIGRIAANDHAVDPAEVDANYVRRSDAELFWKD